MQLVARRVPAGVVDDLELVEVEIHHRVMAARLARARQRAVQPVLELAPVDEAGQRVVRWPGMTAWRRTARSRLTSWNTSTTPVIWPSRSRIGAADWSMAISSPSRRSSDDVGRDLDRGALRAAPARSESAIGWRVGLVDHRSTRSDSGRPSRLAQRPAGQRLGDRIEIFDAARSMSVVITASPMDASVTCARSFSA